MFKFSIAYVLDASRYAKKKRGGVDSNATEIHLREVVVEATMGGAVDSSKYAGGVGILNEKDLVSKKNVIDAIKDIPGIDGGSDFGREIGRRFAIRGFGSGDDERIIIKQDGVRRSMGLYSSMISSFRTDADILKRVEVVKGASSILHGSGAIGGIVNMQTKNAYDYLEGGEKFGAMLGGRLESNNMKSARTAVYGVFGDDTPIDLLLYGKKAWHGDMKFADGGSHYANPKVPKGFNDETIRTLFFKSGVNFLDDHRVEVSVFDFNEKLNTLWQTLNNNSDDLFVKGNLKQRDFAFGYYYTPLNDLIDFSFNAFKADAEYDRGWDWRATQSVGNRQAQYVNYDDRYGFSLKNNAKFNTGFLSHNLVVGAEYENRQEDALWVREFVDTTASAGFASHPNEYKNYGIYLQDIISLGRLDLTLGGRFDKYERKVKKSGSTNFSDSRFSPRVAVAYNIYDGLNILAGYSESFRAPSPHETSQAGYVNRAYYYLPNPNLKSETAKEYEVGLSYDKQNILGNDAFKFKGVYFYGNIKDMIALKARPELGTPPVEPGPRGLDPSRYGQYQNVDNAVRHGFEISANYKIDAFRVGGSFERLRIYDKETKEDLSRHAKKIQFRLGYTPISNLDIDFHLNRYLRSNPNPAIYVSRGTTYYYVDKNFTIADLKATYKVPKGKAKFLSGANINFGINNIFDKQYINASSTATTTQVGRGRNYFVDLELKF